MQKVCFSDKENLPHPKIGKTQHNGSLRIALETQHNGSLRIALETQHNGSLRIALWELSFTEDFVVIPTIDLEIQLFVDKVMIKSVLLSLRSNI
ncbi:hypothetical protein LEP1GSC158_3270 [Leptospira interrogans serovar Zanoni str. LT2156]|uniref:Uncharacterized protein n=1 Tax=Leptospira interrogans serovar Zanoni str. LT2156 TaxID=1001601 RepID=M6HL26_LEPIR|nr:hypothetical protein LEP1GSC158_3270 [Leptospira interrogans serovar Zanoni str. LT2156]